MNIPFEESIIPEKLLTLREIENIVFNPYDENISKYEEIIKNLDQSYLRILHRMIIKSAEVNRRHYKTLGNFWAMLPSPHFNVENTYFTNYLLKRNIAKDNFFYKLPKDFPDTEVVESIFPENSLGYFVINDDLSNVCAEVTLEDPSNLTFSLDGHSYSLFSLACLFGSSQVVQWCKVNSLTINTDVMRAAIKGRNLEIAQIVFEESNLAETFIDVAIMFHNDEFAQWILEDNEVQYNLIRAIEEFNTLAVAYAILSNYDVNIQSPEGDFPLNWAVYYGERPLIEYLLDNGANTELHNDSQTNPLILAANQGYADIVKLLIERGANIEYFGESHRTPIFFAVANNHADIVNYLIEKGASLDVITEDNLDVVFVACFNGSFDCLKILLQHGKKLTKDDFIGACCSPNMELIEFVFKETKEVNYTGIFGYSPLLAAIENNRINVVKHLLEIGADPHLPSDSGTLPLNACITHEMKELVRSYLK
ncbi:hypothetical protein TVAG_346800 [Trichomonas vaginalis G3]|uniref:Uncharacterized protein n=1 Tax=Trichomonas vaginalis (strain ATCC PRA-98 / G3) TaxID=412133 RepID=A2FBP1_TRIV3|nr:protein ubiquitination [Trichomonas vaginalis G3]EAX97678.1 hypothetical protein TVAG_346800 [Trichomonas vaginalis G3]KAI5486325.1 protein ubiquitination [Trichomonas vaginalis G3]|eukprot:XP_001310608.1 hypothetical protein [Trichomonas vaginalis G3]